MIDIPNKLEEYGISPVIGVILMVAITVTLAAIVGLFAVELSQSQSQNAQAGVSVEETENGVKIRLQDSSPSLDRLEILVNGTELDDATIDQVGESVTVTAPEDGSVTVRGVTTDGNNSIIRETTASEDTTGGDSPKVVSGGESTPTSTPTPAPSYDTAPENASQILSNMDGSGTCSDPYVVTNVYELQAMGEDRDACYELGNDIDASYTSNWDTDDDGTIEGFRPVGNQDIVFTGTLNGQGYEITGLYINRPNTQLVGMFGDANGTLTKFGLSDVDIEGENYVGGVVGSNTGEISEVYVDSGSVRSNKQTGGLVGSESGGQIEYTYSLADVYGETSGGLIGSVGGETTVISSYSAGNVTDNTLPDGTTDNNGGLIAVTYGRETVNDSYWDEEASSSDSSASSATGLTTSEMTGSNAQSNMTGFNFTDVWKTSSGDYPELQWEAE